MKKRPGATVLLWLANALGWVAVLALALHQFGVLDWRPAQGLPEVKPLAPRPLELPRAAAEPGARNPFDPDAVRWAAAAAPQRGAPGELRGIVALPGASAALTANGAVRVGEPLAGGRLAGIKGEKLVVENDAGLSEVELPALRTPKLHSAKAAR